MIVPGSIPLEANGAPGAAGTIARAWRRLRPLHFVYATFGGVVLGGLINFTGMQPVLAEDWHANFNIYAGTVLQLVALLLAIVVADEFADRMRRPWIAYVLAIGVAAATGTLALAAVDAVLGVPFMLLRILAGDHGAYVVLLYRLSNVVLLTGLVAFVYVQQRTALRNAGKLHAVQLRSAELARRTLESRLKAMQARVDPQFLFETLAAVERLHGREPALAQRLLEELIAYLRAALPLAREAGSTLATEVGLVRAYLNIVRMDRGLLSFDIALPDALAGAGMPPMILPPLVEAIVGGGKASAASLRVSITASREREIGIAVTARGGAVSTAAIAAALDGIRDRLAALFGAAAGLVVRPGTAGIVEAELRIPHAYAVGTDR
jgi:hypothetical protein